MKPSTQEQRRMQKASNRNVSRTTTRVKPHSKFWWSTKLQICVPFAQASSVKHYIETHIIKHTAVKQSKGLNGEDKARTKANRGLDAADYSYISYLQATEQTEISFKIKCWIFLVPLLNFIYQIRISHHANYITLCCWIKESYNFFYIYKKKEVKSLQT